MAPSTPSTPVRRSGTTGSKGAAPSIRRAGSASSLASTTSRKEHLEALPLRRETSKGHPEALPLRRETSKAHPQALPLRRETSKGNPEALQLRRETSKGHPQVLPLRREISKDYHPKNGRAGASLAPVDPRSLGVDPQILHEYELAMRQVVKLGYIPGFASIVMRRGQVVHSCSHGYADLEAKRPFRLDSMCRLICMTKSYVATTFMMLVEDGLVDLEDRLDKFIPAFADVRVLPEGATKVVKPSVPIRLKHVISHTSGIGYPPDVGEEAEGEIYTSYAKLQRAVQRGTISSLREFVDKLAKVPLIRHPGESYEYGFSHDVLARVIEVVMGKDLETCLKVRLFEPLGMIHTKWHVQDDELDKLAACYANATTWGNLYGGMEGEVPITPRRGLVRVDGMAAENSGWRRGQHCRVKSGGGFMSYARGGLLGTVADTAKFVMMVVNKGVTHTGQRLLKEKTLDIMEQNRLRARWGKGSACYIGNIGVFREGGKEFGMGGAACTYWSIDRADEMAAVWFTQHYDMKDVKEMEGINQKRADLWQAMYDAVRSKGAKLPRAPRASLGGRSASRGAEAPQAARRAHSGRARGPVRHHRLHVRLPAARRASGGGAAGAALSQAPQGGARRKVVAEGRALRQSAAARKKALKRHRLHVRLPSKRRAAQPALNEVKRKAVLVDTKATVPSVKRLRVSLGGR